jgi:hypothetical protein
MHKFILSALIALLSIPQLAQAAETTETYDYALAKLKSNPNNYVWLQESSIENLDFANMVLCIIKNTGADLATQINTGSYVAAVAKSGCDKSSSSTTSSSEGGGNSSAIEYQYFVINATSDGVNLDVKLWVPKEDDSDEEIRARFIFPLARSGSDIGFSELYFKSLPLNPDGSYASTTPKMYGFMKPEIISNGYKLLYGEKNTFDNISFDIWMNLTRTGTGSGVSLTGWTKSYPTSQDNNPNSAPVFAVAANQNELLRQQTVNGTSSEPICFDRTKSKFNTWNYNLYDASTGLLVGGNSSFQIRYGSYRGNYWANGMWLPDAAMEEIFNTSNKTADIFIEDGGNTKNGTVTVSNGGFRKVKKIETALKDIADMTFNLWTGDKEERVYWNKSSSRFEHENGTPLNITAFEDKNWDSIWLNGPGVSYMLKSKKKDKDAPWDPTQKISMPDWSALNNESVAISRVESQVTESELTTLNGKKFNCLANCPFWVSSLNKIISLNASDKTKDVNHVTNITEQGSDKYKYFNYEAGKGYQYTYDHAKRQIFSTDQNISQIPMELDTYKKSWNHEDQLSSIYSGVMALDEEFPLDEMVDKSICSWDSNKTRICGWDYENTVSEYYYWRSGPYSWDKQWTVKINGVVPELPEQLMVRYTCPAGKACAEGSKVVLNYNGAGQLWGIPNSCVSQDNMEEVNCSDQNTSKLWVNKFNINSSPVNANKLTDKVTKLSDSSKEYWVLPQGSAEWYEQKIGACELTLPTGAAQPVNVDDHYKASMTDIGAPPLDYKVAPVTIQNGVKLR